MTLLTVLLSLPFSLREIERNQTCIIVRRFHIPPINPTNTVADLCSSRQTQSIATTLLFGSFNLMLMLRVWILYGRTRRIAYFFFPVLFVEVALMLVLILRPISYVHEFIHIGPALQGCYFSSTVMANMKFALYAVPPLTIVRPASFPSASAFHWHRLFLSCPLSPPLKDSHHVLPHRPKMHRDTPPREHPHGEEFSGRLCG
ncbi:hypothetical protein HMN09_00663700 [Mycena chlorophos]|uniref:Uncharacterized protein n=1 Tax=Mycena chlorophos TaxID=658473 RepID=A0A8H6W706_MYCCL|nr:hypothetical protein HMN09_00663700 [Mycena chlorophos]